MQDFILVLFWAFTENQTFRFFSLKMLSFMQFLLFSINGGFPDGFCFYENLRVLLTSFGQPLFCKVYQKKLI